MGKANGSRERAPDDRLRVPTIAGGMLDGGHVAALLCPPYDRVPKIPSGGIPRRPRNDHAGPAGSEHCVAPALPVGWRNANDNDNPGENTQWRA